MRGLLAICLSAAAAALRGLSWLTLIPSRWLADAAQWCSDRAAALSSPAQHPGETP